MLFCKNSPDPGIIVLLYSLGRFPDFPLESSPSRLPVVGSGKRVNNSPSRKGIYSSGHCSGFTPDSLFMLLLFA